MVTYKTDLRFETLMAMRTLNKFRTGDCDRKSGAAKKILKDKDLFAKFIQMRMDRRNKKFSPKEEKRLTLWKRCVNLICRKA